MPISSAIPAAGIKPPLSASTTDKRQYGERLSHEVALVVASELRKMGARECQPGPLRTGRERQFAGGIGAKRVDVSLATETAGLILGVSIKTINFRDGRTKNYQKNLTNRRGDMLAEVTTLHQRFPYAVVGGIVLFEKWAATDNTRRRPSTFLTAHDFFQAFTGRDKRTDAVEMMEAMMIGLYDPSTPYTTELFKAGEPNRPILLTEYLDTLLSKVATRNADHYRYSGGKLSARPR